MGLSIVSNSYPYAADVVGGRFVQQFAVALSREGIDITVIAPVAYARRRFGPLPPHESCDDQGVRRIRVLRPRFMSYSSKDLLVTNTGRLTQRQFNDAVLRTVRSLDHSPDLLYGHFLYEAGCAAVRAGAAIGRPAVVSVGEGEFWSVRPFGFERARRDFRNASGFLAVASVVRDNLVRDLAIPEGKIRVFPNGVDLTLFKPCDRHAARRAFGIAEDQFVVAFVGHFDRKKGLEFLLDAVRGLSGITLLLVGSGSAATDGCRVAYQGTLAHSRVPLVFAAADVFVLPTLVEGSCNSVIEAIACGLPIVTSNGHYMDDIVDDEVAIRVEPTDAKAIREAVVALVNSPARRAAMSVACVKKSTRFDINVRAKRVLAWLEELTENYPR